MLPRLGAEVPTIEACVDKVLKVLTRIAHLLWPLVAANLVQGWGRVGLCKVLSSRF